MTLEDLKAKATAAELTLIERVESLVSAEATSSAKRRLVDAIKAEPMPDPHREVHAGENWLRRVFQRLDPPAP